MLLRDSGAEGVMGDELRHPGRADGRPLVLVANDHEWSSRSLESTLVADGYSVIRARNGEQAIRMALESEPDLVVLDAQMPDLHGFDVCRRLRMDERIGGGTPIIITTAGPAGRPERFEAAEAGAWDLLPQPLEGDLLRARLANFVRAKIAQDMVRRDGLVDEFTGCYNRAGLTRRARELQSDAARRKLPLSVVALRAGPIEEDPARPDGESVLRHISSVFHRAGRSSDAIGRVGPNEFGVVATVDRAAATRLGARLGSAIEEALGGTRKVQSAMRVSEQAATASDVAMMIQEAVSALLAPSPN